MKIINEKDVDRSQLFMRELESANVGETVSTIIKDVAKNGEVRQGGADRAGS
jgi:hypothetical protein